MAALDPDAAAAAWLGTVSPQVRAAAEIAAAHTREDWLVGLVLTLLICLAAVRTGLLPRLQARIEADRPRPRLTACACAAALAGWLAALSAPWEVFAAWRDAPAAGLAPALASVLRRDLAMLAAAALAVPLLLALVRAAPRRWWAWAAAGWAVLAIAAVWLPYALASGPSDLPPMPQGPARAGVLRLIGETRLPVRQVYVSEEPTLEADVTGLPGHPRVIVTRDMLVKLSPTEIRASVGHVLGHHAHGDQLGYAGLLALLGALGLLATARLFGPAARLMGAHGAAGPADPAGLPVLLALATLWIALATPAANGFIRAINLRADQYSLEHAGEPDGLAGLLVKSRGGEVADPSPLDEVLFHDHPALKGRLRRAMAWKATHQLPS